MSYRRLIPAFLTIVWSIAVLHCLADRATAHWHAINGQPAHHHHDYPTNDEHGEDSHHHSPGDKSSHGDSHHGSADSDCCNEKLLPRTNIAFSDLPNPESPEQFVHRILIAIAIKETIVQVTFFCELPPDSDSTYQLILTKVAATNAPPLA